MRGSAAHDLTAKEIDFDNALVAGDCLPKYVHFMVADHKPQAARHRVGDVVTDCAEAIMLHAGTIPVPWSAFHLTTPEADVPKSTIRLLKVEGPLSPKLFRVYNLSVRVAFERFA